MPGPIIALLTDFGRRDAYVGVMKGVILTICPDATLVDLTHDVPAHALVVGNPARLHGVVCRCGELVARATAAAVPAGAHRCRCGRSVEWPPSPAR